MRSACAELARVSDFSPDNETDEHLRSTIASRWFHERVFDKFLWWNGETSSAAVAKRSAAKQRKSAKDLKARGKALGIYDEVDQKAEQEAQAKYEQWQAEQESVRNERSDSPEVGANHDDPS